MNQVSPSTTDSESSIHTRIDGRILADHILSAVQAQVQTFSKPPVLGIVTCAPNFETRTYLSFKEKKARAIGIALTIVELDMSATTNDVIQAVSDCVSSCDAVVVQLPLPAHIDRDRVLESLPSSHDADALNPSTTRVLSPVVGAMKYILNKESITVRNTNVTIIGGGLLVGLPAYRWFVQEGAHVSLVTRDTHDVSYYTRTADIVVCGAGSPKMLTPNMVREGVVVLDAGTSEDNGELSGDADPRIIEKARLYTPVPGGIGPMTIAILLQNVANLAEDKM
jgi:methylenetetrahydrofolate dehydrogenase (NADP+) / methenyltetrahydrofolate cyclohydrolase